MIGPIESAPVFGSIVMFAVICVFADKITLFEFATYVPTAAVFAFAKAPLA